MQIAADAVASWSTARPEITGEFPRERGCTFEILA